MWNVSKDNPDYADIGSCPECDSCDVTLDCLDWSYVSDTLKLDYVCEACGCAYSVTAHVDNVQVTGRE